MHMPAAPQNVVSRCCIKMQTKHRIPSLARAAWPSRDLSAFSPGATSHGQDDGCSTGVADVDERVNAVDGELPMEEKRGRGGKKSSKREREAEKTRKEEKMKRRREMEEKKKKKDMVTRSQACPDVQLDGAQRSPGFRSTTRIARFSSRHQRIRESEQRVRAENQSRESEYPRIRVSEDQRSRESEDQSQGFRVLKYQNPNIKESEC